MTTANGLVVGNRSGASARQMYRNGALAASDTAASAGALPADTIWLLGDGQGIYTARQIAAASVGASLDATEQAAFYAALHAYLTAVGAV
jgi:hypothetical protein